VVALRASLIRLFLSYFGGVLPVDFIARILESASIFLFFGMAVCGGDPWLVVLEFLSYLLLVRNL